MGAPRTLKNFALFANGAWLADTKEVTRAKLTTKLEEWRGGAMDAPLQLDMGMEKIDFEYSLAGPDRNAISGFRGSLSGENLRFAGAYQDDATGTVTQIEITVRGRVSEVDPGSQKAGEPGEYKTKVACSYYREEWDGRVLIEIDILNMVCIVDGVDRLAELRAAIGI